MHTVQFEVMYRKPHEAGRFCAVDVHASLAELELLDREGYLIREGAGVGRIYVIDALTRLSELDLQIC